MSECPVAVFARPPIPGTVKTRLAPALGARGAAEIYRAFVVDTLATCRAATRVAAELWVAHDAHETDDEFLSDVARALPMRRQPQTDLGGRMASALGALIAARGVGMVLGTDAPTLPPATLEAAAALTRHHDVVLGPSADGGFYLVGAQGAVPPIFAGIRYSSRHALSDTLRAAARHRLSVATLPPWYDVDTPGDLALLRLHLTVDPGAAPATAARLLEGPAEGSPIG